MTSDKQVRKDTPIASGVLDYFPDAIADVAHVSYVGNQQHNPGQPMHWDRSKSKDQADCIARHLLERGTLDTDGLRHSAKVAWRALALLQEELEQVEKNKPLLAALDVQVCANPSYHADGCDCAPKPSPKLGEVNYTDQLIRLGCPRKIATQIRKGTTVWTGQWWPYRGLLYVAGPMRNIAEFNFPMFDAAVRYANARYDVISPADIDRASEDTQAAIKEDDQRVFVLRDFWSLYLLASVPNKAILMLPGWEKSRGASAEFHLARWLRIPTHLFLPGGPGECSFMAEYKP